MLWSPHTEQQSRIKYPANELLVKEFPEVTGNQSTLLSQINAFKSQGKESIQIHRDGARGHWIMSNMSEGQVIHVLYDSKRAPKLSEDIQGE